MLLFTQYGVICFPVRISTDWGKQLPITPPGLVLTTLLNPHFSEVLECNIVSLPYITFPLHGGFQVQFTGQDWRWSTHSQTMLQRAHSAKKKPHRKEKRGKERKGKGREGKGKKEQVQLEKFHYNVTAREWDLHRPARRLLNHPRGSTW